MIRKLIDEHGGLISLTLIVVIFVTFGLLRKNRVDDFGVYTIARIVKYESDASGSSLYIEVFFQGDTLNTVVNSSCFECDKNNRFYFVRLLKENPKYDIYFLEDYPVPECMLKRHIPKSGWKELPRCN